MIKHLRNPNTARGVQYGEFRVNSIASKFQVIKYAARNFVLLEVSFAVLHTKLPGFTIEKLNSLVNYVNFFSRSSSLNATRLEQNLVMADSLNEKS